MAGSEEKGLPRQPRWSLTGQVRSDALMREGREPPERADKVAGGKTLPTAWRRYLDLYRQGPGRVERPTSGLPGAPGTLYWAHDLTARVEPSILASLQRVCALPDWGPDPYYGRLIPPQTSLSCSSQVLFSFPYRRLFPSF